MHLERRTIVTRLRSLMDFTLRCVRFYPGVNSRAELVTLAPGLRPELRAVGLGMNTKPRRIAFTTLQSSVFIRGDHGLKLQRGFLYTQGMTPFANKMKILLW